MPGDEYFGQSWDKRFRLDQPGDPIPDGILSVFGEPATLRSLLERAKEHGWTMGRVSLVARFNPPSTHYPPFFSSWELLEGKWRFTGARARNLQHIGARDLKTIIEHPEFLLPEEPDRERD